MKGLKRTYNVLCFIENLYVWKLNKNNDMQTNVTLNETGRGKP